MHIPLRLIVFLLLQSQLCLRGVSTCYYFCFTLCMMVTSNDMLRCILSISIGFTLVLSFCPMICIQYIRRYSTGSTYNIPGTISTGVIIHDRSELCSDFSQYFNMFNNSIFSIVNTPYSKYPYTHTSSSDWLHPFIHTEPLCSIGAGILLHLVRLTVASLPH